MSACPHRTPGAPICWHRRLGYTRFSRCHVPDASEILQQLSCLPVEEQFSCVDCSNGDATDFYMLVHNISSPTVLTTLLQKLKQSTDQRWRTSHQFAQLMRAGVDHALAKGSCPDLEACLEMLQLVAPDLQFAHKLWPQGDIRLVPLTLGRMLKVLHRYQAHGAIDGWRAYMFLFHTWIDGSLLSWLSQGHVIAGFLSLALRYMYQEDAKPMLRTLLTEVRQRLGLKPQLLALAQNRKFRPPDRDSLFLQPVLVTLVADYVCEVDEQEQTLLEQVQPQMTMYLQRQERKEATRQKRARKRKAKSREGKASRSKKVTRKEQ